MKQHDLICTECPLVDCDTESLWCIHRFVTDPNEAQQRFVNRTIRKNRSKVKRKDYFAHRYLENREAILKAANERHAANRLAKQAIGKTELA